MGRLVHFGFGKFVGKFVHFNLGFIWAVIFLACLDNFWGVLLFLDWLVIVLCLVR